MESLRRRALSEFYREEFRRHLDHLRGSGVIREGRSEAVDRACQKLLRDLEAYCHSEGFPRVAESLLERFDALTRLSLTESRTSH